MSTLPELERQILALPPAERARLASLAWESFVGDPDVAGDRAIDPEGIAIALQRDAEAESGRVQLISRAEFLRRTGSASE
jgi:hypothetical protein